MLNILIVGISGKMGEKVYSLVKNSLDTVVAGVDKIKKGEFDCPVYKTFDEVKESVDVIIDFSNPSLLEGVLSFAIKNLCPLVECTTGYSEKDLKKIKSAAEKIPVFLSSNTSLGVNLTKELCAVATKKLKNYQIDIIEKHRLGKIDSPSGTALLIAEEIKNAKGGDVKIQTSPPSKRKEKDLVVHSIRGGSLIGEHEILFLGEDEIISIKHTALSKDLFAKGALKAAKIIVKKENGLFGNEILE